MNSAFLKSGLIIVLSLSGLFLSGQAQSKYLDLTADNLNCLARGLRQQRTQINLKTECPEVYYALWQNGLTKILEAPLPEQVSLGKLRILQASVQLASKSRRLDESILDALLADIYIAKPEDQETTWWKQFLGWLNSFKSEQYEQEFNWLVKFLQAITPSVETARTIMYIMFGLIILLAVGLVLRELHLAGVLVRRKHKSNPDNPIAENTLGKTKQPLSFLEIKQLDPSTQSIALLKNVMGHLVAKENLPQNAALTNFELKQYLQSQNVSIAQVFSKLLLDVEPVLYGNSIPSSHQLERCWQYAEQIIKE